MKIENILNEFESDWCESVTNIKGFKYKNLKNKTILISSGENHFAEVITKSFFKINDVKKLNMKIIILIDDNKKIIQNEFFNKREDFSYKTYSDLESMINDNCININYLIYTGCCNKNIEYNVQNFMNEVESMQRVLNLSSKLNLDRFILLSDYRVYGKTEKNYVISEYEYGEFNLLDEQDFETNLIQTLENICCVYAKQYNFSYVTLRTGIIYGASTEFEDDILCNIIESINTGKEYNLIRSKNKFSYIYISDLLSALFISLYKCRENTVYNVADRESQVTTMELATIFDNIFPEKLNINSVSNEYKSYHCVALNSDKLRRYGWKPNVKIKDGLILLTKSKLNPKEIFIFDDSYDGKLNIIHNILLAYLLDIDKICKKHDIKYFLAGGTLLGAIRHGGFIPWDDDVDIMMLREDYDKFTSIVQSELHHNLFFQNPETESLNHCVFNKIRLNNTIFATKHTSKFLNMHNGIFIDVLAHDKTSNNKLIQKIHVKLTYIVRTIVLHKWKDTTFKGKRYRPIVYKFIKKIQDIIPIKYLEYIEDKILTLYKSSTKSGFLYDGMGRNIKNGVFPSEWLDESIYFDFEGYKFPVPKEYDKYLRYLYGEYMEMIPVSKRRTSHSIVLMDLGAYCKFKVEK